MAIRTYLNRLRFYFDYKYLFYKFCQTSEFHVFFYDCRLRIDAAQGFIFIIGVHAIVNTIRLYSENNKNYIEKSTPANWFTYMNAREENVCRSILGS